MLGADQCAFGGGGIEIAGGVGVAGEPHVEPRNSLVQFIAYPVHPLAVPGDDHEPKCGKCGDGAGEHVFEGDVGTGVGKHPDVGDDSWSGVGEAFVNEPDQGSIDLTG